MPEKKNSKKEKLDANQLKLTKIIDKNRKLPSDYTGTFIDYFNAEGESVPTQTGAAVAVVNEFKNGKRVQEVFVSFRQGGAEVGGDKKETNKAKETPPKGNKPGSGAPTATPEKGQAKKAATNRV